jgi:hypothetical protein
MTQIVVITTVTAQKTNSSIVYSRVGKVGSLKKAGPENVNMCKQKYITRCSTQKHGTE